MNRSREHAAALFRKAQEDAWMMRTLMARPDAPGWGIGFHAQQAVEKAIKAVLAQAGVEYPYSHDLLTLLNVLKAGGFPLPPDASDLPKLTPFGAVLRYDDDSGVSATAADQAMFLRCVDSTLGWAQSKL